MDDDASCEEIVLAISKRIVDLEQAPVAAWDQVDQLNDQINELKHQVANDSHHRKMAEQKAERYRDEMRNIEARFEVVKEVLQGIDFPQ